MHCWSSYSAQLHDWQHWIWYFSLWHSWKCCTNPQYLVRSMQTDVSTEFGWMISGKQIGTNWKTINMHKNIISSKHEMPNLATQAWQIIKIFVKCEFRYQWWEQMWWIVWLRCSYCSWWPDIWSPFSVFAFSCRRPRPVESFPSSNTSHPDPFHQLVYIRPGTEVVLKTKAFFKTTF